jgi:hypothetical protein
VGENYSLIPGNFKILLETINDVMDLGNRIIKGASVDYQKLSLDVDEIIKNILEGLGFLRENLDSFYMANNTKDKTKMMVWATSFVNYDVKINNVSMNCHKIKEIKDKEFGNILKRFFSRDRKRFEKTNRSLEMISESDMSLKNILRYIIYQQLLPIRQTIIADSTANVFEIHKDTINALIQERNALDQQVEALSKTRDGLEKI